MEIRYLREYRALGTAGGLYHCQYTVTFLIHSPAQKRRVNLCLLFLFFLLPWIFANPSVRDAILPNLKEFFVINADICSSFPLDQLIDLHSKHRGVGTIMGVNVRSPCFRLERSLSG